MKKSLVLLGYRHNVILQLCSPLHPNMDYASMPIEWFTIHTPLLVRISAPNSWYGAVVILVYVALTLFLFKRNFSDFQQLNSRRSSLVVLLAVSAVIFTHTIVLQIPESLSLASTLVPSALLAFLPIIVCSVWLGRGPAILIGLLTGASWMLLRTSRITQPFEIAFVALAISSMMQQRYKGRIRNLASPTSDCHFLKRNDRWMASNTV